MASQCLRMLPTCQLGAWDKVCSTWPMTAGKSICGCTDCAYCCYCPRRAIGQVRRSSCGTSAYKRGRPRQSTTAGVTLRLPGRAWASVTMSHACWLLQNLSHAPGSTTAPVAPGAQHNTSSTASLVSLTCATSNRLIVSCTTASGQHGHQMAPRPTAIYLSQHKVCPPCPLFDQLLAEQEVPRRAADCHAFCHC
jgi:hypothetical protein